MSSAGTAAGTAAVTVWSPEPLTLGEGPLAHDGRGSLVWFDILGRTLHEKRFDGGPTRTHRLPVMASAAALVDGRRVLLATEADLRLFDLEDGTSGVVAALEADDPGTRSNDARVHPCGAFWIGTMGRGAEPERGSVWWFLGGEMRLLFARVTIPNSICFAPDGSTAYFADTARATIWRVETDPATGLPLGDPAVFCAFGPGEGAPDGSVVDGDGTLWNARWGGWSLDGYAPDGARTASVRLPVAQPTCPAFAGAALDRLVVTTARENLSEDDLAGQPAAGAVLHVDLPVRGRAEPRVRLA